MRCATDMMPSSVHFKPLAEGFPQTHIIHVQQRRWGLFGKLAIAILSIIAVLGGCAESIQVNSDYDPATNFSGFHTYNWLPAPQNAIGGPSNSLLDARIREAVENQLALRGYDKQTTGSPDFLVNYHVVVKGVLDVRTIHDTYGYGRRYRGGWGGGMGTSTTYVREAQQGTVFLDFLNPQTQDLLWRGTAQGYIDPSLKPEEKTKRIHKAVGLLLDQFPPK